MSQHVKWLTRLGLWSTFMIIIIGQLIWVFDPWHFAERYWIENIEVVWYFTMIPFMIWCYTATLSIIQVKSLSLYVARQKYFYICIQGLLSLSSLCTMILIVFHRDAIVGLAISAGTACILAILVLIIYGRGWITGAISISVMIFLLFPTSYMVTYPGLTIDMNRYVYIGSGHSQAEIQGVLVFERPAFLSDFLYARLFPAYSFVKRQQNEPSLSEQLQQVRIQKYNANQIASAVAFNILGIGEGSTSQGVLLLSVIAHTPADGLLLQDDVIIQANGQPVHTTNEFIAIMSKLKPGTQIELTIVRQLKQMEIVLTSQASESDPHKAVLGIQITDHIELDLPLQTQYRSFWLHEGGPSHGAMLTVAIIDQLTSGGVTNGHLIAGTGTVDIAGNIGAIGGLNQKTYTIARGRADVFFVPYAQYGIAYDALTSYETKTGQSSGVLIIPVKKINDILQWLSTHPYSIP